MKFLPLLPTLALSFMLTGCLADRFTSPPVEEVFTKDGSAGYAIRCSGINRSWAQCFERASELCGEKGYTQHAKNSGKNAERSLIVACKE